MKKIKQVITNLLTAFTIIEPKEPTNILVEQADRMREASDRVRNAGIYVLFSNFRYMKVINPVTNSLDQLDNPFEVDSYLQYFSKTK